MKEEAFIPAPPVKIQPLTQRKAWNALAAHFNHARNLHLGELSAQDPKRGERMTLEAAGLYLDYPKNRVTDETLKLLFQLATESGLRERIPEVESIEEPRLSHDNSTNNLIRRYRKMRKTV